MTSIKAALAEFVGTFALTFIGAGAIIMTFARGGGGSSLIVVAIAHGLILSVMVSATMHISGGQFNPAVSLALGVIRKQPWERAVTFIIAQLIGSICAASLLRAVFAGLASGDGQTSALMAANLGATLGGMELPATTVLVLEIIATFFLMWVIMGTGVDARGVGQTFSIGGFGIGLTVAANILAIGPATGASMNPARSFGPALILALGKVPRWDMHWVYWVGPIIGAIVAAVIYDAAYSNRRSA